MREHEKVAVITIILVIIGIVSMQFASYTDNFTNSFNFYKSELTVNGLNITEKLYYYTDKPYHTLYRNFVDPLYSLSDNINSNNYISISSVSCSEGDAYFKTINSDCFNEYNKPTACLAYTENNEYGCSFGDTYGFKNNQDYEIGSNYLVHPENLFLIKGNYYTKFVVYSPNNHRYLDKNNFIVSGDVVKAKRYYSKDNVVIYIPYYGDRTGLNIITKSNFEFDTSLNLFVLYFIALFPAIIFFFSWFFFGKELVDEDVPNSLSMFPNENRKPYEVSEYFNAPYMTAGPNFFASTLLSFYHNKIIDIKSKDNNSLLSFGKKSIYVKINSFSGDDIEKQVYDLLVKLKEKARSEDCDGAYFNLDKTMKYFLIGLELNKIGKSIQKDIKIKGKDYLNNNGPIIPIILSFLLIFITGSLELYFLMPLMFISLAIIFITSYFSAILIRYKSENYIEYKKWQAFKVYLSRSFTISKGDTQMIKLWDEYLVFATALGVSKKVIEELKSKNLIDENQYYIYSGIGSSSMSMASSSGTSGGHGGAGGGGVGGGGGGGR